MSLPTVASRSFMAASFAPRACFSFHRASCSAVSNSALATSASTSRLLNARSPAFIANLMVTPTMVIADNEIQPYHKPLEVLKPSVTSPINCSGSLKTNQRKRRRTSSLAYKRTSVPNARVSINSTIMILAWVFINKTVKKVVLALHREAILRCNQEIAKGICSRCWEKFCGDNRSIHKTSKKGSSFRRISQGRFFAPRPFGARRVHYARFWGGALTDSTRPSSPLSRLQKRLEKERL